MKLLPQPACSRFSVRTARLGPLLLGAIVAGWIGVIGRPAFAENGSVYVPIPLTPGKEVRDTLSDRDIPTGQGGFARDYIVQLQAGDQIAIDLVSDTFDPVVVLMTKDGNKIGENDDGPDGTSNSLLFMRITKTGQYIVRVQSFGETAGGDFRLTLTKLQKVP